jgi:Domain of unknown function (DUF4124)
MVRIPGFVGAILLAGVAAVASAETVYKWIDSRGQVHYTDLPPRQADAKLLGVYQQEAGIVEETGSTDDYTEEGDGDTEPTGQQPEVPSTPEPPPSEEAMAAVEADAAKARVERCKAAQDRYQRYIESRRLFRETPDGKRVYLTDQELTEARARAKQAVIDYCG